MKHMLDTNMCIYLRKNNPESVARKFHALNIDDVVISSIVFSELVYGVHNSQHFEKNMASLKKLITPIAILPYDEAAAHHYGEIRSYLKKAGTPIGQADIMIAAHALSINATLVTNNMKEFSRIKHLRCENWT
ncbi:MAG: hypothetical protein A3E82_07975 [Gammaproteobacteria bacterium RIFCSPHIGHO2_12_FULL_38_11]|nr:MAG: hypothetical protein A3E82_07975 [Gammaproteobacteria bacterium RIFCSPHIGHO2_12_FULL_38_11]